MEDVHLKLIDSGYDIVEVNEVDQAIRIEIGYADGTDLTRFVELAHGALCAIDIIEGMMDQ